MKLKLFLGLAGSAFLLMSTSGVMAYPVNSQGVIDIETVKKREDLTPFSDCRIIYSHILECDVIYTKLTKRALFEKNRKRETKRVKDVRINLDYCSPGTLVKTDANRMKCGLNTEVISGSFLRSCEVDGIYSYGNTQNIFHVNCKGPRQKGRLVGLLGDGKNYYGHYVPAKRKRKSRDYPYELYVNPNVCASKTYWNEKGVLRCVGQ
jgi:hypothetical protein